MIDLPIEQINWTTNSEKLMGKKTDSGRISKKAVIEAAKKIEPLRFQTVVETKMQLPLMFSMAIHGIIKDMKYQYPSVLTIGQTSELAPYGLYSISYRYKDNDVTSLWLDQGDMVTCLVSYVHAGRKEWHEEKTAT